MAKIIDDGKLEVVADCVHNNHYCAATCDTARVFVVIRGCRYEGGGIVDIFDTMPKADSCAEELAQKENSYHASLDPKKFPSLSLWRYVRDGNSWNCNSDYISIVEWDVK